ncbi:MAG: 3-isopropylmalate dehydratase small subunit [Planctomycetaceae bacterium]
MTEIKHVTGRGVPLLLDDIDTDRIIPARYLRCVTFDGLGEHAFEDDRTQDAAHPFNDERFVGASVLISGRNFGCGSSREHAPQSLLRWGIHAIVAESFAEIFFGNCTSLGIPCVTASRNDLERIAAAVRACPEVELNVDLQTCEIRYGDEAIDIAIPASTRNALMTGRYDFLGQLIDAAPQVRETADRLPYVNAFASS